MKYFLILALAAAAFSTEPGDISADRMRAHVKYLASDKLEGRGVGTPGEKLATEYIADQFKIAGAKPAGENGTYFQRVPMVGVATEPSATVSASLNNQTTSFRWLDDFVGVTELQQTNVQFDADAIFVGHGIVAPEFQWDDFKGVDVKGKVLILFTNEPPSTNPRFFGGSALTYYGRWSYKYEEAARHGAKAVFILHTTPTAGYGWDVVRSSWSGEDPELKLEPGHPALAFSAWFTQEAGEKFLKMAGKSVDELLKAANSRDFHPIPLGIRIRGSVPAKVRPIESRNVVAMVPGSDPKLRSEAVVFSAHWDHLGIGPAIDGDKIYNGAVDNASGCAILMEMAHAWAALPEKPRRSAIFVAVTAEEGGLRGSEFYADHPPIAMGKTALNLNFDGFPPFGRTTDISVTGAERTTAWPLVQAAARRMNLAIKAETHPEQGFFYRSDHFSFAHAGVPAFSVELGTDYEGKPRGYGDKVFEEYNAKHYHRPSDEYHDDWNFGGMQEVAQFGLGLAITVANQDGLPTWHKGDEFLPAREKSFGGK